MADQYNIPYYIRRPDWQNEPSSVDMAMEERKRKIAASRSKVSVVAPQKANIPANTSPSMDQKFQAAAPAAQNISRQLASSQQGETNELGGGFTGAAQGAASGMAFGAPGAIIGAGVGGGLGILKARAAKKKARAEAEARKEEQLGEVEQKKAQQINIALSNIMEGFRSALLRG